jgi:hypothetical protein
MGGEGAGGEEGAVHLPMESRMKLAAYSIAAAAALLAGGALVAQTAAPSPEPTAPQPAPDIPVSAVEAKQAALELAGILEETYVFPDVATLYGEALRAKAASGAYDDLGSAEALAGRLTADLRAVAPDNHLRVMPGAADHGAPGVRRVVVRGGPGAAGSGPGVRRIVVGGPDGAGPRMMMPSVDPVEAAGWLAPGIAYVRFNLFPGTPEAVAAAQAFIADHADAKALIFDIRTHRGGGLAEMDAIFPYLFARPATLVAMDTRASVDRAGGNPMVDGPTLRRVPADEDVVRREHFVTPHAGESRLFDARVYVLTSPFTGSAAEHFALALKRTGRATLVGETTAGAGNYGGLRRIGDKLSVFVPVGRTFDPDTGKGWEGTGVAPDVEAPAPRALVEALVLSGVPQAEAERLSAGVHPKGPMQRIVPRH